MRQRYTVVMVLVVIIALVMYWYEEHKAERNSFSHHVVASPVTVAVVKREAVPNQINAIGTLQALRQVDIASQMAGQIIGILYIPGSYVKGGKVLIQLEKDIYEARLSSAESAWHLASIDYQRVLKLARSGAASRQLLDQKRAAYQQAKAMVKTSKTLLAETRLKAPFSGYIGPKNYSVGDYVDQGEKLTTLTDRSQLLVNYQLSEHYLPQLSLGQKVEVSLPGDKSDIVTGKVSYISPIIDQITHGIPIQATIPNKHNHLTPGLFVNVRQITHVNPHALVIPQSSIVPTIIGPKVFVVNSNNTVHELRVKTGSTFNNVIEIREGLTVGEKVVTAGQQRLEDGSVVKEVSS